MKKLVIGIGGAKGAGKSFMSELIEKTYEAKRIAFARKLKETCASVFIYPLADSYSNNGKETKRKIPFTIDKRKILKILKAYDLDECSLKNLHIDDDFLELKYSVRGLLQYIGTDILRAIDDNIHIKWALKEIPDGIYVIEDCRFKNEINVSDFSIYFTTNKKNEDVHASENSVNSDDFTYNITNNYDEIAGIKMFNLINKELEERGYDK